MAGLVKTLWHYGKQAGLNQLDPKHYGTGLKGDELTRILHGGAPPRTYFYTKPDVAPEAGLGPHRYTAQVPEADLYDMQADPEGIYAQALQQYTIPERVTDFGTFPEKVDRQAAATAAELELMNRGFKGYIGRNDSAAMFGPVDVQPYTPPAPQGIMDTLSGYSDEGLRTIRDMASNDGSMDEVARYNRELARRGLAPAAVGAVGIGMLGQSEEAEANIFGNVAKNAGKFLTPDEQLLLSNKVVDQFYKMRSAMPSAEEMAVVAKAGQSKKGWYRASAQALMDVFGADAPRFSGLLAALSPQTGVEDNLLNALNVWVNWDMAGRPTDPKMIRQIMGQSVQGTGTEASVLDAWVNNSIRSLSVPDEELGKLVLSGPKVDSFMRNLNGVLSEVTNDTWQANYMGVDQTLFSGNARVGKDLPDVPAYQNLTKIEEMIPGLGASDYRKIGGKGPGYLAANDLTREAAVRLSELTGEQWEPAEIQEAVWSWARTLANKERKGGPPIQELAAGMQDAEIADTADFGSLLSSGQYHDILERNPAYEGVLPGLERTHTYPQAGSTFTEEAMSLPGGEEHLMNAAGRLSRLGPVLPAAGVGMMGLAGSEEADAAPMGTLAERIRMATREAFHGTPHTFQPMARVLDHATGREAIIPLDEARAGSNQYDIIEEFDQGRFDHSRMGTGEGAQAYGWGTYLSSSKGVAKGYRDGLSSRQLRINGFDLLDPDGHQEWVWDTKMKLMANKEVDGGDVDAYDIANQMASGILQGSNAVRRGDAKTIAEGADQFLSRQREYNRKIIEGRREQLKKMFPLDDAEIDQLRAFVEEPVAVTDEVLNSFGITSQKTPPKALVEQAIESIVAKKGGLYLSNGKELPVKPFLEEAIASLRQMNTSSNQVRIADQARDSLPGYLPPEAETISGGSLYRTEIPAEDHLMDWQKPFSEQSDWVKERLRPAFDEFANKVIADEFEGKYRWEMPGTNRRTFGSLPTAQSGFDYDTPEEAKQAALEYFQKRMTGKDIYYRLMDPKATYADNPAKQVSERLRDEFGIPGHTFIGRESQRRNYVIYDEDKMNIIERGLVDPDLLPYLAAGGAAGAVGVGQVTRGETSKQPENFRDRIDEFTRRRTAKRNAGKDYLHAAAQMVGDVGSSILGPVAAGIGNMQLQRQRLMTGGRLSMDEMEANRSIFDYEPQGNPLTQQWQQQAMAWVGDFIRQVSEQQAPQQAIRLAKEYNLPAMLESMGEAYNQLPEDVRVYLESLSDASEAVL